MGANDHQPAQPAQQVAPAPAEAPFPAVTPSAGKRCLIVDDSRVIRRLSRQILEAIGFTVTEAEDGEEALAKCKVTMPDLILTDWNMPVMSGIDFVSTLRQMDHGAHPKVVFCTTNSDALDIHKAIAAGADHYVVKPFDQTSLCASLAKIGAA